MHLHAFQAAHPAIELEVRLSDRPVDLVRNGVDLALRRQLQLEDSSPVAVPLMTLERAVAAPRANWQRHGKPVTPEDLSVHNCLMNLLGSNAPRWQFDGPDGPRTVEVRGSLRADNSVPIIDAMVRGVGVGLVPRVMMPAELADGRLQTALDARTVSARQFCAVYPSRDDLPERVRVFVRFPKARLSGAED